MSDFFSNLEGRKEEKRKREEAAANFKKYKSKKIKELFNQFEEWLEPAIKNENISLKPDNRGGYSDSSNIFNIIVENIDIRIGPSTIVYENAIKLDINYGGIRGRGTNPHYNEQESGIEFDQTNEVWKLDFNYKELKYDKDDLTKEKFLNVLDALINNKYKL